MNVVNKGFEEISELTHFVPSGSAGMADYIYVSMLVVQTVEINGVNVDINWVNGVGYYANDYNSPSNDFCIDESEESCEVFAKVYDLVESDFEDEENEDIQELIEESDMFETVSDVRSMFYFLRENRPSVAHFGYSIDTDDYTYDCSKPKAAKIKHSTTIMMHRV